MSTQTTKYTDLYNEVIPELPGAPLPMVLNAIRNTVIDFCEGSQIWREWLDPMNVECGIHTYDIETNAGVDIVQLLSVKYHEWLLTPRNEDQLDEWNPRWRHELRRPDHFMQHRLDQVTLACVPDRNIAGGLLLSVSIKPDRNSQTFPGWIYAKYFDGLTAGAKARMMKMLNKPWSNPQQANAYEATYLAERASARGDAAHSLSRSRAIARSNH